MGDGQWSGEDPYCQSELTVNIISSLSQLQAIRETPGQKIHVGFIGQVCPFFIRDPTKIANFKMP